MTEAQFQLLLQRYLDGQCTPEEVIAVEQWYNRLEETEGKALRSLNQEAVEDAIWQRIQAKKQTEAPAPIVVQHPAGFWQRPQLQWAALLLFAIGLGLLYPLLRQFQNTRQLSHATANGWTRRSNTTALEQAFRLPDGSKITLHPGSSLRYATGLAGPKREVYLEGEAFFQVSKNPARPFLVFTKQVVTTVLGTSFRVKAYAGSKEASVAVREGKVSVQASDRAQLDATPAKPATHGVVLLPNQQVVYSVAKHHLRKELVDKPVMLAPQSFEFEERPVAEVLTALEKAYGVTIAYDKAKLSGCTVSIAFYDEPLFEKLGLLCKSLGAYYTLSETQITIHSTGCQLSPQS
ncbi:FecR family protein [Hymenobacter fodinae]|uniref:FecR family protein n=1 Tax=Hymenobacter fodinae TaxID=2510796 RepID=UPI001436BA66|nr:FecR family protein [Hymenobacter fodinae]